MYNYKLLNIMLSLQLNIIHINNHTLHITHIYNNNENNNGLIVEESVRS